MSETEERLLTYMKELTKEGGYAWPVCVPEEELVRAEAMLGFPLPSLLRGIYLEVGNRAFGLSPLYELPHDLALPLVESYIELRSEPGGGENGYVPWPEKLLIIYDYGCNIYSCLDCAHPGHRILQYDSSKDLTGFALEAPSFRQWLQALLDGTQQFDWDTAEKVTF
jgi:hypothetical protein